MTDEEKGSYLGTRMNGNLVGVDPSQLLLHGPTKRLVNTYHWHSPYKGIVASYSPTERDVEDHFNVFRGVDQIEAFAQATIVSGGTFLESRKLKAMPDVLRDKFVPAFISIGNVSFQNYVEVGDRFIS